MKEGTLLIYGIGHDLVEIARMQSVLGRSTGEKFIQRILTPAEMDLPGMKHRLPEYLAGRFAAKEAISKALGTGIGAALSFQDIEVLPGAAGRPQAFISDEAWVRLGLSGSEEYRVHVSITHERNMASAFAIIECTSLA